MGSGDAQEVCTASNYIETDMKEAQEMKTPRWVALGGFFLATVLCVPAWSQSQGETRPAGRPGTVNYVEGQVAIGDYKKTPPEATERGFSLDGKRAAETARWETYWGTFNGL